MVRKENLLTDLVWIVVSQDMTWVYIQSNLLVSIYLFSKVIVRRITPGLPLNKLLLLSLLADEVKVDQSCPSYSEVIKVLCSADPGNWQKITKSTMTKITESRTYNCSKKIDPLRTLSLSTLIN